MVLEMKAPKMFFSQREEIQLNPDTKIIIMKPGQDLFLRFAPKIDKLIKVLFGKKDTLLSWTESEEEYAFVNSIVKPILIYCLRNPTDYRRRLLVDQDQTPGPDQEYYEDFNPVIDAKILESQGYFKNPEDGGSSKIFTPQLTLFFIILRKSGWISTEEDGVKEEEEVESFPEKSGGNEETDNSKTV